MPSTKLKVHKAQKEDRAIITGNVRRKFGEVTRSSWDMCKDRQRDRQTDEQTCSWQYSAPLPRGGVTVTWSGCRTDFHCALNVEMSGTTHSMLLLHLGHTQTHRQGSVQYPPSHTHRHTHTHRQSSVQYPPSHTHRHTHTHTDKAVCNTQPHTHRQTRHCAIHCTADMIWTTQLCSLTVYTTWNAISLTTWPVRVSWHFVSDL